MIDGATFVEVEVAAAVPDRQEVVALRLPPGATVADAVVASKLLQRFPEIGTRMPDCAIHGVRVPPRQVLTTGDRVELLRPLAVDPREARRRRARRRAD